MWKFNLNLFCFLLLSTVLAFAQNIPPAEPSSGDQQSEVSLEEFLQRLSSVRNVFDRRDPFKKVDPIFTASVSNEKKENGDSEVKEVDPESIPVLERFDVEKYIIAATFLGDSYAKVLIRVPDGTTFIANEQDRLGNKGGVIQSIARSNIVVLEKIRNTRGEFEDVEKKIQVGNKPEN